MKKFKQKLIFRICQSCNKEFDPNKVSIFPIREESYHSWLSGKIITFHSKGRGFDLTRSENLFDALLKETP
jgi:hypothetical protein